VAEGLVRELPGAGIQLAVVGRHSDFEPKFSVAPLTFGTLKAAFYAMLVAVPLAVLGAIFAAYFMSPQMRSVVKPSIEIMEALPTVILGFLAGLWLAPWSTTTCRHPAGDLLLPFSFVITSYVWHPAAARSDRARRDGLGGRAADAGDHRSWLVFQIGHPIEAAFFGGDMPQLAVNELGITYEQRNSLVVGIAMGFAVIPTIFSIAEDACSACPSTSPRARWRWARRPGRRCSTWCC
jgi:phosphate transport system permease protein